MYLLDTNVLSAIRKREPFAIAWLSGIPRRTTWISVITLGEVAKGVAMKGRRDPIAAGHLAQWLAEIEISYLDRTIPIDGQISMRWGEIAALRTRGVPDGLIAATAIIHGLTLVTRNVADFADTGVAIVNPWAA